MGHSLSKGRWSTVRRYDLYHFERNNFGHFGDRPPKSANCMALGWVWPQRRVSKRELMSLGSRSDEPGVSGRSSWGLSELSLWSFFIWQGRRATRRRAVICDRIPLTANGASRKRAPTRSRQTSLCFRAENKKLCLSHSPRRNVWL